MAYGKKYDISWSDLRGKSFTAEIYQDGFGGSSTKVKAEDTVCEISYPPDGNLLSPVKSSQANLRLYSETDFQWQEFFVTEVGEYFLKLIQDGDTIWQGMIVDTVYIEPYVDVPYSIKLIFSCGLSELKNIDYLDGSGDFLTGIESLHIIIRRCLNKLPYNLRLREMVNCFDDNMMTTTVGTLGKTYISNLTFVDVDKAGKMKPRSCRYVIEEIMKGLGCRIFQSSNDPPMLGGIQNIWWVQRIEELSDEDESQLDFWEYKTDKNLYTKGQLTSLTKTITNTGAGITLLHSDAELEITPAVKTIKYKRKLAYEWAIRNNLILDESFKFWIKNADSGLGESYESYKPRYWFFSSALQALSNFNDNNTEILDDDYIQRLSVDGGIRWGSELFEQYIERNLDLYMEAQFFSIGIDPYSAPSPRSTRAVVQINSANKLEFIYDIDIYKKLDTDLAGIQYSINIFLVFQIILKDLATANLYSLAGVISADGTPSVQYGWIAGNTGRVDVFKICDRNVTTFFQSHETPTLPFTGSAELTFRIVAPIKLDLLLDNNTVVNWIDKIDFKECDLRYKNDKNLLTDIEEEIHLQDSDLIRDNDYSITVLFGDGPSQATLSSFRYNVPYSFPITDKWSRLNASPAQDKSAKDIFLIDVLKNFMSTQKTKLSGTLYGLTDFNFQNIIISDKSVRYIMDRMTWNLKTGEKKVTLLELTTEAGAWEESLRLAEAILDTEVISGPVGGISAEGDVVSSGTLAIGDSVGMVTIVIGTDNQSADISNYPF